MLSRTGLRVARVMRSPNLLSRPTARHATDSTKQVQNTGNTVDKLEGVYDNAFNRERLAVKKHAAASAGMS